jgi:hypothetical protein
MTSSSIDKGLEVSYTEEAHLRTVRSPGQTTLLGGSPWWKFGGHDRVFVPSGVGASEESLSSLQKDTGSGSDNNIEENVFSDPRSAELYEPIEKYEGKHRFDPSATWSIEEETKLVRKVSTGNCSKKRRVNIKSCVDRFQNLLMGLYHVLRLTT